MSLPPKTQKLFENFIEQYLHPKFGDKSWGKFRIKDMVITTQKGQPVMLYIKDEQGNEWCIRGDNGDEK